MRRRGLGQYTSVSYKPIPTEETSSPTQIRRKPVALIDDKIAEIDGYRFDVNKFNSVYEIENVVYRPFWILPICKIYNSEDEIVEWNMVYIHQSRVPAKLSYPSSQYHVYDDRLVPINVKLVKIKDIMYAATDHVLWSDVRVAIMPTCVVIGDLV